METRRRSLLTTVSWRVIATLITALAAWYISSDLQIGVQIGLLDVAIKLLAFYWHERLGPDPLRPGAPSWYALAGQRNQAPAVSSVRFLVSSRGATRTVSRS